MSTTVTTPYFRVSYPSVFKAKKNELNGKDEYSVVALFPFGKDSPELKQLKEAAQEAIAAKWGTDKKKWPEVLKSPFRDQKERAKKNDKGDLVLPDGYVGGNIFMTFRSTQKPGIVAPNGKDIIHDETEFYAGCWARAVVNFRAFDQKGNRGVAAYLQHVQKQKDDAPFGNRMKAEDAFSAIEGAAAASGAGTDASTLFD